MFPALDCISNESIHVPVKRFDLDSIQGHSADDALKIFLFLF